jgi:ketosteroid isomerase-like protein
VVRGAQIAATAAVTVAVAGCGVTPLRDTATGRAVPASQTASTLAADGAAIAGGTPRDLRGNFLRIYRRQPDGSWRMTRDMFSSDQPPAAN